MTDEFMLELKRQLVHLLVGLFEALLVFMLKPVYGWLVVFPLLATLLFLYYSPRVGMHLPGIRHLVIHFERTADVAEFPFKGAFFFNTGIIAPVLLLDGQMAAAVIAVLAFGDSASTLFGKFFGTPRINGKSIEGFTAFIVFGYMGALLFVPVKIALLFAVVGAIVELTLRINDNLSIPVSLTFAALVLRFF